METIFFTGFSGTGKTMIGKLLASRKSLSFLDVDEYIEKKENKKILDIFRDNGEGYFRKLETYTLNNAIKQGMIVALGGGTVVNDNNVVTIKKSGRVIYLRAKVDTICENLKTDYMTRPLLKDNFTPIYIEKMLKDRIPYYERVADYIIDIDDKKIDDIFKEALAIYNLLSKVKCHIYIK